MRQLLPLNGYILHTSVPRSLRYAPAPGNAFVLSVETSDSSTHVIRESVNEREREIEIGIEICLLFVGCSPVTIFT